MSILMQRKIEKLESENERMKAEIKTFKAEKQWDINRAKESIEYYKAKAELAYSINWKRSMSEFAEAEFAKTMTDNVVLSELLDKAITEMSVMLGFDAPPADSYKREMYEFIGRCKVAIGPRRAVKKGVSEGHSVSTWPQ